MALVKLIYRSEPVNYDFTMIDAILAASDRNNAASDVTGALLHSPFFFLQYLEGPRERVSAQFLRIAQDPRHRRIAVISCGDVPERLFDAWSMHGVGRESPGRTYLQCRLDSELFAMIDGSVAPIEAFFREMSKIEHELLTAA